ncbi:MAG: aldehyde dehydrogenase family protein [bacterium]|nr:MAG: aldehyde dehydrogenase family protein [bacterium]
MADTISGIETIDVGKEIQHIDRVFRELQRRRTENPIPDISSRLEKLQKLENWILSHRAEISEALSADFGKPVPETESQEIFSALTELRHARKKLKNWIKPRKVRRTLPLFANRGWVEYVPKGVVLIMAPWNYPFLLTTGPLISAVAAGNSIMLKPSEFSIHTSRLVKTMVSELFSIDEITVIYGHKEVAAELLKYPFDHIYFTGSSEVGKLVMTAAARNLTSVTLELGGKSPAIIHPSANLEDAAKKIAWGRFMNAGQTCVAPDYVLVPEELRENLVELLKRNLSQFYGKNEQQQESTPDFARIIDQRHFQRLKKLLEEALQNGATLEYGGNFQNDGLFISPTLLTGVSPDRQIMQEEIFGPILPIITYTSLEEAIRYINERGRPLAVYIFSQNKKVVPRIFSQTSSGGGGINEVLIQFVHPNLPFGGIRESGFGNAHGYYGFKAFSHEKAFIQGYSWSPLKLLYPPYPAWKKKVIDILIRYF